MSLPRKYSRAFTLVELLVVMAIISILAIIIIGGFRSSQMRGRDAQRKSNLKQIATALELFFADYSKYPPATGTQIASCSYNPSNGTGTSCAWDSGNMSDGKTTYMRTVPADPVSVQNYVYRVSSTQNMFQLFARLENSEDKNCINGNCLNPGITVTCGGGYTCNFGVSSTNTSPLDTLP
ncbi:MAG: prepilin-type N-terminal cleavage/methylation domain-containing protein [Patescibacteria group bacterium]